MNNPVLYGFSKKDLENTIELVIKKLQKTELNSGKINPTEDERLNQKQVAQLLGKSEQCIIKWKKENLIPYYQIGSSPFFFKNEVLDFARKNPSLVKPTYRK